MELGNATFHCWLEDGHGTVNVVRALERSCDVFFYEVALKTGIQRIKAMANKLGREALFYATLLALLTIHAAVAEGTQAQAGGVGQRQQPAAAALTTAAYDVAGEAISIGEMRRRLTEASPTTRSRDFLN